MVQVPTPSAVRCRADGFQVVRALFDDVLQIPIRPSDLQDLYEDAVSESRPDSKAISKRFDLASRRIGDDPSGYPSDVENQTPSIAKVLKALTGQPVSLDVAKSAKGLPAVGGLYAWWTTNDSIPGVPSCPHPSEKLDLFYVGIAPKDQASGATLRSRVAGNHINGNTGSSTFRRTLAALLFRKMKWQPRITDRPLLSTQDNAALRDWQHQHLRLTWADHPRPWEIEKDVIEKLAPPLNLAGNTSHPFHQTLSNARTSFKNAAQPTGNRKRSHVTQKITRPVAANPTGKLTLHSEIADILRENGNRWMTTEEIARAVARRKRYLKKDRTSAVTAFQVHGRTKNYPDLFERKASKVRLLQS